MNINIEHIEKLYRTPRSLTCISNPYKNTTLEELGLVSVFLLYDFYKEGITKTNLGKLGARGLGTLYKTNTQLMITERGNIIDSTKLLAIKLAKAHMLPALWGTENTKSGYFRSFQYWELVSLI